MIAVAVGRGGGGKLCAAAWRGNLRQVGGRYSTVGVGATEI